MRKVEAAVEVVASALLLFLLVGMSLLSGARRREIERELGECKALPRVLVANPPAAIDHIGDLACAELAPAATCPPCARRTRPPTADRWVEHAATEWRQCEEALDRR